MATILFFKKKSKHDVDLFKMDQFAIHGSVNQFNFSSNLIVTGHLISHDLIMILICM